MTTLRLAPPAALMEDLPPPPLAPGDISRDQLRLALVDMGGYAARLRARLAALRQWSRASP
ncbi:hypothetical protein GALL_207880 [mine drainage metagenome]|uniref:Uncharacterized protein n=1 Tax=mine drainage metagenome TaxID=410659 RepID=A0A1J5RNU0_9ZZZZ